MIKNLTIKTLSKIRNFNNFYKGMDIGYGLQIKARNETVEYIEKNDSLMSVSRSNTRQEVLKRSLKEVTVKNGLYCEFGVFTGSTIRFIAFNNPKEKIYGFDSFEGLPEKWRADFETGHFSVPKLPKVPSNVTLIKGFFENTLKNFMKENKNKKIAFLHIDSDLYSSAKTIFTEMEDAFTNGTVIVFDEFFNYPGWKQDEFKAFNEFITKTNWSFDYITFNQKGHQLSLKLKNNNSLHAK